MNLNLEMLRLGNKLRLPQFKNSKGEPAHSKADGSDWTPSDWLEALVGEVGEYANFHKKFKRGDITLAEFKVHAAKELADVLTYLDLLAQRCLDVPGDPHPTGIDLERATAEKFNEVSQRVGCNVFLMPDLDADSYFVAESFTSPAGDTWLSQPRSGDMVSVADAERAAFVVDHVGSSYGEGEGHTTVIVGYTENRAVLQPGARLQLESGQVLPSVPAIDSNGHGFNSGDLARAMVGGY